MPQKTKLLTGPLLIFFFILVFAKSTLAQVGSACTPAGQPLVAGQSCCDGNPPPVGSICGPYDLPSSISSSQPVDYHTLRPLPGKATVEEVPQTQLCGNSLVFTDKISVTYSEFTDNCSISEDEQTLICNYKVPRSLSVIIDLSEAKLPIMGNTEDVVNKNNKEDTLTDAEKVNEYVSWYLNGVINKAEYPFLDVNNPLDLRKIVDYSGPLRKLLPWDLQIYPKLDLLQRVDENTGILNTNVNEGKVYNQIVGCTTLLFGKPIPCDQSLENIWRLDDWNKKGPTVIGGILNTLQGTARKIFSNPAEWIVSWISNWQYAKPPLRANYKEFKDYYVDYKEWRGKYCAVGPFNTIFCYGDILKTDLWADLFAYIPFSSTEDRKGSVEYTFTQTKSGDVDILNPDFATGSAVLLYFPHMQETSETAQLLQETFTPKGITMEDVSDIEPVTVQSDCKIVEARTSSGGDSLYPSSDSIEAFLTYTAGFTCYFDVESINKGSIPTCTKNVTMKISTTTFTPLADDVWSRLVAGSNSIARRILPKTGSDSTLGSLRDIPAASKISYSSSNLTEGQTGTLYFPHIGGISEYFLKGIQAALRPKGYADPVSFGAYQDLACTDGSAGSIPNLPTASEECSLAKTSSKYSVITLPPTLIKAIEGAAESYQIPPSLVLGLMFGEGAFNRTNWGWVYTEANVKKWIQGCELMPHCDANSSVAEGPLQWIPSSWEEHKDAIKIIDPQREPNRCNLLDGIYAAAKKVSAEANGPSIPNPVRAPINSCFGIDFNTGNGGYNTCGDWDIQDVATGIRQWSGSCLSNVGSGIFGDSIGYCTEPSVCETYQMCASGTCTSYYSFIFGVYNHFKNY